MITRGVPGRTFIPYIVDLRIKTEASGSRVSDACFAALAIERGCEWDVGWAIRPGYVEGQIQGGVAQRIGWALNEEYIYDAKGRMDNPGFLNYRVPVASDMPMIEPILVEVPNPAYPQGAKGVGEVNIVPPMAAIANAIDSAIHRRLTELPMSPPKIVAALEAGQTDD
jgi:CO/xanthine dehydrogenase Mo-binding subunit